MRDGIIEGPLTAEEWQEFLADFAQLSDVRKHCLMEHIRHVADLTRRGRFERVWKESAPVAHILGAAPSSAAITCEDLHE